LACVSFRPLTVGSTVRQGSVQALGIRKAAGGVFFQALQNDCFQVGGQLGSQLGQPPNRFVEVVQDHLNGVVTLKRWAARQQKVGHGTQTVDVAAGVQWMPARRLLW